MQRLNIAIKYWKSIDWLNFPTLWQCE